MDVDREANFRMAVDSVKSGRLSYRKASKHFGLPIATLCDRVKGRTLPGSKSGKRPQLNLADEQEIVDYANKRSSLGIGLSKKNFLTYVGSLARLRGTPFKEGHLSEKWWKLFKKRHPSMSLRKPEATSAIRHTSMTRQRINKYFDVLAGVLAEHKLSPSEIWNMDECGLQLAHRPNKVLARKKNKSLHFKVSSSKETITMLACGNAAGRYLPPHVIIPGKTFNSTKAYDTENAPPGTMISASESGWTKQGISEKWFVDLFLQHIGEKRPQLLILDGHDSHGHLEILERARNNNIILLELPAHTSNWTQPFDRSVFKPLKTKWFQYCDEFVTLTGLEIKKMQFFRTLKKAWDDAMKPDVLQAGFRACGIVPLNRDAIPQEAYAPSNLYIQSDKEVVSISHDDEEQDTPSETQVNQIEVEVEVHSTADGNVVPTANYEEGQVTPSEIQENQIEVEVEVHSTADGNDQEHQEAMDQTVMGIICPNTSNRPEQNDEIINDDTIIESANNPDLTTEAFDLSLASQEELMNISGLSVMLGIGDVHDTPSIETAPESTEEMALRAVESALSPEQRAKFLSAELSGKEIDDPLFFTWKKYRTKTTPVSSLFPIPTVQPSQRKRKPKPGSGYFILTCEEAYQEKKKALEEKIKKENEKKERLERKKIKSNDKK